MFRASLAVLVCLSVACRVAAAADDPVFSGPQVGEKLPPLKARGVFGDQAGKEIELVKADDDKPVALIFVHARTRPAFGLTNTIMKYAATRGRDGLSSSVILLSDDVTETDKWLHVVQKHLPKGVVHAISTDGPAGPGSYGLNRNVTLTVLIGKAGKVTANLALVQPSLQADGPKILKAIVEATGGGKVPTLAELGGGRYRAAPAPRGQTDPKLAALVRAVINKQASDKEVAEAAAKVEEYVEKNETARKQLGRISNTVVNSGKLSNYGTPAAQGVLRAWAKKYPKPAADAGNRKKQDSRRKE